MTDVDAITAEVFRLIDEVAKPASSQSEDALDGLKRLAGLERDVAIMLIVQGLAAHDHVEGEAATIPLCAFMMFLGAILSSEYQKRQRVISIEKAKRALPDETTRADEGASKGGQ